MYEYPFGNGQQLNLDWFLSEWKNLLAAWEAEKNGIDGALQAEIDRAEAALADVFAARDAAAQSAANALESKNAAAQSASDASGYLATVRADANTASNAAQNAAQSESNAAESAQTAVASKNAAGQSERNAAQSEANALAYKNAAAQSEANALAYKNAAAQSAADADASKSAAAQSAEDASDAAASVEASAQQITTNANNISDLKESISDSTHIINVNEEGSIITFKDGSNSSLISLLSNIDKTNRTKAAIVCCGKNICKNQATTKTEGGITWEVNADGTITVSGNATSYSALNVGNVPINNKMGTLILSGIEGLSNIIWSNISLLDKNNNTIRTITSGSSSPTIEINLTENDEDATSLQIGLKRSNNGVASGTAKIQLELGPVATQYEQFVGDYYQIDFPSSVGAISNGEIDVLNGILRTGDNTYQIGKKEINTLNGFNTIYSTVGDVNLEYTANMKLYIDNKITELQATMLENIGG